VKRALSESVVPVEFLCTCVLWSLLNGLWYKWMTVMSRDHLPLPRHFELHRHIMATVAIFVCYFVSERVAFISGTDKTRCWSAVHTASEGLGCTASMTRRNVRGNVNV